PSPGALRSDRAPDRGRDVASREQALVPSDAHREGGRSAGPTTDRGPRLLSRRLTACAGSGWRRRPETARVAPAAARALDPPPAAAATAPAGGAAAAAPVGRWPR